MLPVVRGDGRRRARSCSTRSSSSPSRSSVGIWLGPLYTAAALVLGGVFLALAWQLRATRPRGGAASSSTTRSLYLALLFVAAAVNPVLL